MTRRTLIKICGLTRAADVQAAVQAGVASVVVKGSRSMRMEQVVQALQAASAQQGAGVC